MLSLHAALSSGVFPARNGALSPLIPGRKIPPSARFSLPAAVFHRDGQSGNRGIGSANQTRVEALSFLPY